jgi:hypothetical protein
MRRRLSAAAVVASFVMVALSACTASGVDGRLFDDWAPLGEAKISTPVAGSCYASGTSNAFRIEPGSLESVSSCAADHAVELAHVGQITGADANAAAAPAPNGATAKSAYADCAEAVRGFLGDTWQSARVLLVVQFPSDAQWDGGARYYRCDLVEIADEAGKVVGRKESLRDGLRGTKPAALSCANDFGDNEDSVDGVDFVACGAKHTAEFSGVFTVTPAGRAFPAGDTLSKIILDGCEGLAAKYLGLPNTNIPQGLGWFSMGTSEDDWVHGNQSVRCYVGVFDRDRPIRGGATIKGLGNKPIPR